MGKNSHSTLQRYYAIKHKNKSKTEWLHQPPVCEHTKSIRIEIVMNRNYYIRFLKTQDSRHKTQHIMYGQAQLAAGNDKYRLRVSDVSQILKL